MEETVEVFTEEQKKKLAKKLARKRRWNWFSIAAFVYLSIYTAWLIFRVGWAFVKSIHQFEDFILSGASVTSWPGAFSFDSYVKVLSVIKYAIRDKDGTTHNIYMLEMVWNGLLFAAINTFVREAVILCVSYVLAKYDFWFNKVILGVFYFHMLVPIVGTMSAGLKLHTNLGLQDTWLGIVVQNLHFLGGLSLLIYRDSFKKLSDGYSEAAKIDGAGQFRIMVEICFPLLKGLIVMGILTGMLTNWNDYTTPLVYLPSHPTVAYGLYIFNQAKAGGENAEFAFVPYKLAGFMLLLLPSTAIFWICKNKVLRATETGGGMKE